MYLPDRSGHVIRAWRAWRSGDDEHANARRRNPRHMGSHKWLCTAPVQQLSNRASIRRRHHLRCPCLATICPGGQPWQHIRLPSPVHLQSRGLACLKTYTNHCLSGSSKCRQQCRVRLYSSLCATSFVTCRQLDKQSACAPGPQTPPPARCCQRHSWRTHSTGRRGAARRDPESSDPIRGSDMLDMCWVPQLTWQATALRACVQAIKVVCSSLR